MDQHLGDNESCLTERVEIQTDSQTLLDCFQSTSSRGPLPLPLRPFELFLRCRSRSINGQCVQPDSDLFPVPTPERIFQSSYTCQVGPVELDVVCQDL